MGPTLPAEKGAASSRGAPAAAQVGEGIKHKRPGHGGASQGCSGGGAGGAVARNSEGVMQCSTRTARAFIQPWAHTSRALPAAHTRPPERMAAVKAAAPQLSSPRPATQPAKLRMGITGAGGSSAGTASVAGGTAASGAAASGAGAGAASGGPAQGPAPSSKL